MDEDIEMVDAPNNRPHHSPEVGRPGLRPPPGFEHLVSSPAPSDSDSSSNAESTIVRSPGPDEDSIELCESGLATHDREMEDSFDHKTSGLLPPQPEISPLRINKLRDGQPVPSDSTGPSSESAGGSANSQITTYNNNQGSESGLFPFPPPVSDEPPADGGPDRTTDEKQAEEPRVTRPTTYVHLDYHHHHQILGLMHRKIDDIKLQEEWGNFSIFHLDWSAGNPKDPNTTTTEELEDMSAGKRQELSKEDLALRGQISELVKSFVNEVQGPPKDDDWSKPMFFGDWIANSSNEVVFFLEMQIKRISGADNDLMKRCGINPRYVWLPFADFDLDDPVPCSQPSSPVRGNEERPVSPEPRLLRSPTGRITGPGGKTSDEYPDRPSASIPHSGTFSSLGEIIRASENRRFGNLNEVLGTTMQDKANPVLPLIHGIEPENGHAESPLDNKPSGPHATETPLENIDPSLLCFTDDQESDGLPRILPKPPAEGSASWGSNIPTSGSIPTSNGDDENDDSFNTDDTIAKASEGFSRSSHRVRNLLAHQKILRERREQTIEKLTKQPNFSWRKDNSYIYCVRVLAIPEVSPISNHFTGPVANRKATLLASGGWIVPPWEERVKWHNEDKENRAEFLGSSDDIATQYFKTIPGTPIPHGDEDIAQPFDATEEEEELKKPYACRALPAKFDWSGNSPPRYYGEPCPIWRELAEPCLEDVYWLVWQLLGGTQYVGFRNGSGFGRPRTGTKGEQEILAHNPFESPSPEALHLSRVLAKRL